jgi:hypothetical protein
MSRRSRNGDENPDASFFRGGRELPHNIWSSMGRRYKNFRFDAKLLQKFPPRLEDRPVRIAAYNNTDYRHEIIFPQPRARADARSIMLFLLMTQESLRPSKKFCKPQAGSPQNEMILKAEKLL